MRWIQRKISVSLTRFFDWGESSPFGLIVWWTVIIFVVAGAIFATAALI